LDIASDKKLVLIACKRDSAKEDMAFLWKHSKFGYRKIEIPWPIKTTCCAVDYVGEFKKYEKMLESSHWGRPHN
jgi:hypothetical protein